MAEHPRGSIVPSTTNHRLSIFFALTSLLCSALAIYAASKWNSEYIRYNQKLLSNPGSSGTWIDHFSNYRRLTYSLSPIAGLLSALALIPLGRGRRPFLTLAVPAFLVSLFAMLPLVVLVAFLLGFRT